MLYGLIIGAQKHLDLGTEREGVMDIRKEAVTIKAYQTLRVLFNRWSLKGKDKVGVEDSKDWVDGLKE